jgi:hypothetical protein
MSRLESGPRQQFPSDFPDDLVRSIQKVLNFQNSFEVCLNLEFDQIPSIS